MDILLTGASGFVGRHLADALAKEHRVFPVNRHPAGIAREIVHDFAHPLPSDKLPGRIDAVIHTAGLVGHQANTSPLCIRVNVTATRELAEYAIRARAQRFVFFSTGGVYRPTEGRLTEQSAVSPPDDYTQSKLEAEIAANSLKDDLVVQILRLFFPFGPTQRGRLIPNLIGHIFRNEPIPLTNDLGQPLVTPLYIDDLIEYVRRVLLIPDSFVANLAGDEVVSIRNLACMIARVLDRTPRFEVREGRPIYNLMGDNGIISQLTNFSPRVSLELGFERTVSGFSDHCT
jgi:nucleoside-diphosphate-sugar epimerase